MGLTYYLGYIKRNVFITGHPGLDADACEKIIKAMLEGLLENDW